jgi:ABC-type multidrug transport system ATPase subunit
MLAINNLSVVYQNKTVLEGFNLSLEKGEIFAL